MATISCKNVSVCYLVGDVKSVGLKEFIMRKIKGNIEVKKLWANKDISFEIEKGDMLGIIGSNGAGKSTLLKAISGIMRPSEGTIECNGKIAALLELTSGFDSNLTVRENTFLRGALLGYTRKFMEEQYDEIIAFAELEDYQDYFFKQLSSGMKSRLAFSIACLVNPDILILDEVLSVGDSAFKKKSGNKMKEILSGGITGILVSHSSSQVKQMCNKVLWLDHGKEIAFGDDVDTWCDAYECFQTTKKLPQNYEEALAMAEKYRADCELEQAENAKKRLKELEQTITGDASDELVAEAIKMLKKYKPEALVQEDNSEEADNQNAQ